MTDVFSLNSRLISQYNRILADEAHGQREQQTQSRLRVEPLIVVDRRGEHGVGRDEASIGDTPRSWVRRGWFDEWRLGTGVDAHRG